MKRFLLAGLLTLGCARGGVHRPADTVTIDARDATVRSLVEQFARQLPHVKFGFDGTNWPEDFRVERFTVTDAPWRWALERLMHQTGGDAADQVEGGILVSRPARFGGHPLSDMRSVVDLVRRLYGVDVILDPGVQGQVPTPEGMPTCEAMLEECAQRLGDFELIKVDERTYRVARRVPTLPAIDFMLAELQLLAVMPSAGVTKEIARLIEQLDEGPIDERDCVEHALVAHGTAAIAQVLQARAVERISAETRARLASVVTRLWETVGPSYVVWCGSHAIDARMGSVAWSAPETKRALVRGSEIVLEDAGGSVSARDLRTGRVLGERTMRSEEWNGTPNVELPAHRIPPDTAILAVSADRHHALLATRGTDLWKDAPELRSVELDSGRVQWRVPLAHGDSVTIATQSDVVFVCVWTGPCCGGPVLSCRRRSDGRELWSANLRAIGPVLHSLFWHRVSLELRGRLVVAIGENASGAYVESFDVADGARVARWSSRNAR